MTFSEKNVSQMFCECTKYRPKLLTTYCRYTNN